MRRKLIVFIALLLLAMFVAAGLFVALVDRIDLNEYREPLSRAISDATGFDWDIEGDLEAKLGLLPAIVVHDLVVRNPDPRWAEPLAQAQRVELQVQVWRALLTGQLGLRRASFHGVHLNLHVDREGDANWRGVPPVESEAEIARSDPKLDIRLVESFDVRLNYHDGQSDRSLSGQLHEVVLAADRDDGLVELSVVGRLSDHDFSVQAELERDVIARVSAGERTRVAAVAVLPDARLTIVGTSGGEELERGLDLQVSGQAKSLAPLMGWLDEPYGLDGHAMGPVDVSARVVSKAGLIDIEDLRLEVGARGGDRLEARGRVADVLDERVVELEASVEFAALEEVLARIELPGWGLGRSEASVNLTLRPGEIELRTLSARLHHHSGALGILRGDVTLTDQAIVGELDVELEAERVGQVLEIFEHLLPVLDADEEPPEWRRVWSHPLARALGPVEASGRLEGDFSAPSLTGLDAAVGGSDGEWVKGRGNIRELYRGKGVELDLEFGTANLKSLLEELEQRSMPLGLAIVRGHLTDRAGHLAVQAIHVEARDGESALITASGDLERLDTPAIEGWHIGASVRERGFLARVFELPARSWGMPIEATARLDASEERISARDLVFGLGESEIRGVATIQLGRQPRPLIEVELSSEDLLLQDLGIKPAEQGAAKPGTTKSRWLSPTSIDFGRLLDFDGRLDLEVGQLRGRGGLQIANAAVKVDVRDGLLDIHEVHLRWQEGWVRAAARVDASRRPPQHALRLQTRGVRIDQLFAQRVREKVASGRLEVSMDLQSSGNSRAAIWEGMAGEIFLHANDGEVATKYSTALQLDLLTEINPAYVAPEVETLNCLISDVSVKAGRFDVSTLLFDTPYTQVLASGYVDVPAWLLKVVLTPVFRENTRGSVAAAVVVRGPLDNPTARVEPFATASSATRGAIKQAMQPVRRYFPFFSKALDDVRRSTGLVAEELTGVEALWVPGKDMSCEIVLATERVERARSLDVDGLTEGRAMSR